MKVIIAGSRELKGGTSLIDNAVQSSGFIVTEVVSGCARGVDTFGELWAGQHAIPVIRMPAEWNRYGRQAGIVRNCGMGNYADALIAVWDSKSKGTSHMIDYMHALWKPTYVLTVEAGRARLIA